jgi:hypothetical protein
VKGLADPWAFRPARAGDNARALLGEQPRRLAADSFAGAGDDADAISEA